MKDILRPLQSAMLGY